MKRGTRKDARLWWALAAAAGLAAVLALSVPAVRTVSQTASAGTETKAFGIVRAGAKPLELKLARAIADQPAGPETLTAVDIQPVAKVRLTPEAHITLTAPLYDGELSDWLGGIKVTPERYAAYDRRADKIYGPLPVRARMFHLWLDQDGRVTRMHHVFSP